MVILYESARTGFGDELWGKRAFKIPSIASDLYVNMLCFD